MTNQEILSAIVDTIPAMRDIEDARMEYHNKDGKLTYKLEIDLKDRKLSDNTERLALSDTVPAYDNQPYTKRN